MFKKCSWKRVLVANGLILLLLMGIIAFIVIMSYLYGEKINSNELFCGLVGTFIGIFFALMFDRIIENFKSINTLKNWLILLKKELTPILKIQSNSNVQFSCLSNLVNSSDFTLFIKDEELLSSLYNLNNNLKKFENGQHDGDLIETIKNDINNVLKFIN